MKRYIDPKAKTAENTPPMVPNSTDEQLGANFDVQVQLDKLNVVLEREVRNLMGESSRGKLSKASSTDLVNYIKLLSELKTEELKLLSQLSDEELERKLK